MVLNREQARLTARLTLDRYVSVSTQEVVMYAVFYRNLNLGHAGSPNREQLETALANAGAERVKSFQTNGTVLIAGSDPERIVRSAALELKEVAGYDDVAIVRALNDVKDALSLGVFEEHESPRTYRETVTFFQGGEKPSWPLPWTNSKDDVDILHIENGIALSLIRKPRNTAGNPTYELERETGAVATTRTRGTIDRLLKAAASWR